MSAAAGEMIPVELSGGPFCGAQMDVVMLHPPFDTYIMRHPAIDEVHAYCFANRTTTGGKHWVLQHLQRVAKSNPKNP